MFFFLFFFLVFPSFFLVGAGYCPLFSIHSVLVIDVSLKYYKFILLGTEEFVQYSIWFTVVNLI